MGVQMPQEEGAILGVVWALTSIGNLRCCVDAKGIIQSLKRRAAEGTRTHQEMR